MGDFGLKIERFLEVFIDKNGYVRVLEGLENTSYNSGNRTFDRHSHRYLNCSGKSSTQR